MQFTNPNLIVVILAAGLSQRLGFPKQLIVKHGKTLLEEKIELARSLNPKNIVVVLPANQAWSQQIRQQLQNLPIQIIFNQQPITGMADSIKLAVNALRQQQVANDMRVLFLTVDQVALTFADLKQLTSSSVIHNLLVSQYQQNSRAFGIPVNLPFAFLDEFADKLKGDKGFRSLWQNGEQVTSSVTATIYQLKSIYLPHLIHDIDTLEQFEQLCDQFQLSLPIILVK